MKIPKYHLYLTDDEYRLVLQSLVALKNNLIREGRYTDAVDELIIKISKAKKKRAPQKILCKRCSTKSRISYYQCA